MKVLSSFLFPAVLVGLVGCSHMTTETASSARRPAADGGDVGSVGANSLSCSVSEKAAVQIKEAATKAAKAYSGANGGALILNQHPLTDLKKPSVYENYIRQEFIYDSAMRNQVIDQLLSLQDNGHNTSNMDLYLGTDGSYCNRIQPSKIKVVHVSGDPESLETLRADIQFRDGFHGGWNIVTMSFQFEVRNVVDRGEHMSSNYKPRFSSYLSKYPIYLKTDSIECDIGEKMPKACEDASN